MKEYTQYKVLREKAGLSVKQVMEALNVSDAAVYFWETGANAPSTKKLPDIAKLYGCTVDELLNEVKPSVPKPID
jgi:transcriptional regulator with XRE-family HTH domain